MNYMNKSLMLAVTLLLFTASALAQTSRGAVSGIVSDPTDAVVPGATVTLTNDQTGVSRTTSTNGEGLYRFDAVDLGSYSLKIAATGFGDVNKTNILVSANQVAQVDAQLAPGGQTLSVDVTAESGALLQTEAPVRGGNIETQRITELPFAGRNPVALALTIPGVSTNRNGFGVGTFSVNGGRGRSNNFLIDGTENNDISVAGQGFQITNPDAVQEVSVQTSNYDAEFGRAGGAVVNTITKSGTNEFHGTLSYLLDSRRDDALTSSESRDPDNADRGRPPFGIENIYSGTIGGPIIKNRTFFFGAFQEDRQRQSGQVQLLTPTAAGRADLRRIFAAGTNANVDLLLSATEQAVANSSPFNLALGTDTRTGVDRGNIQFGTFFRNFAANNNIRQWQARVDHKLTESDQLSGRFLSNEQDNPKGGGLGFDGFDADFEARLYNFLLSETHVFSSTVTNEARIAYNRLNFGFPLSDPDGPAGQLPRITLGSANAPIISPLGASTTFPQGRIANNYTIQDTISILRGNHTFRTGVDLLRQISTQAAPFNPRGSLTYSATDNFTALANFVDDFGGGSGTASRDFGSAIYFPSLYRTAAFFQDRWRATDALTLTLGLRYEYFGTPFNTLMTPAFTGLFNVDPVTRTGPFGLPNEVSGDKNNFAPTIGIALSPSFTEGLLGRLVGQRKTVVRAGYQMGYDSFFNNIASNAATSSPNIVVTTTNSTVSAANPRGLVNFASRIPTTQAPLSALSGQTLIDPNLVNPYYQRFSLGVQRELPYDVVVDLSYVGSKGTRLYINEDANPLVRPELRVTPAGFTGSTTCTPGAAGCLISGRLDNLQGPRTVRTNGGSSIYHSAQLSVTRRVKNNFTVTGSYTWSKLIDNASEVFAADGTSSTSVFALPAIFGGDRFERGLSLFDRTHRASFTYVYELPFLREQRGLIGRIGGGWQVSGVTVFESGVPFTVFNGFDADGIGGNNDRPNFNPNGQRGVRAVPVVATADNPGPPGTPRGTILGYVNPDANNAPIDPSTARFIANPTFTGQAGSVPRFGTLGRNTERTPGINNFDFNIQKRTRVNETTSLEFRTEFYNIFNHPQYTIGSVSPFSPTGGTIGSNLNTTVAGRFLNPNTAVSDGGGRVVRFQLKLLF
jgi:Carboxypeptidase regulatory-like domain/TonB-dependent Receptor Plug Domain/TonB dependent receptor